MEKLNILGYRNITAQEEQGIQNRSAKETFPVGALHKITHRICIS